MDQNRTLHVIKIGGKLINNKDELDKFITIFSSIPGPKILVHGGGQKATELSALLGIETRMVDGRRITDKETLEIAIMVYAGLINKSLVARLQAIGTNAMGLCGADGNIIKAITRPVREIDYGFVGDVTSVNAESLNGLIALNILPVLSAISHDGNGQLLNTNADTIASQVAIAMSDLYEVHLNYCFEFDGVLYDLDTPDLTMQQISLSEFRDLQESKSINKGMIPKLSNGFEALKGGVNEVTICGVANLLSQERATMLTL